MSKELVNNMNLEYTDLNTDSFCKVINKRSEMKKGQLFVLSGPSGTGKGTICKELISKYVNARLSVSMTTRGPRTGEIDGESYFFVTDEHFSNVLDVDGFLEYAEVYGSMYGTPKKPVLEALDQGIDVILEIDIQGALKVKESFPQGIFIFILPPSLKELEERLRKRGTESEDSIALRLSKAIDELSYINRYDYYVVNGDLDAASKNVAAIMKAEHSRVNNYTNTVVKHIIDNS